MKIQTSISRLKLIICLFLFIFCHTNAQQKEHSAGETTNEAQFPFPEIPNTLTSPEKRKEYLLKHYWDKFNFADTALINNRAVTEQGFVNHIALMGDGQTPELLVNESVYNFCRLMEQHSYAQNVLTQMVDDYLYSPASPFYNESLYIVYLKNMVKNKNIDGAKKSLLLFKLNLVKRNQPGTKASDFTYYRNGNNNTLSGTSVGGNYLILLFYDPECTDCRKVVRLMAEDNGLSTAVRNKKITILAVYPEGDMNVWKQSLSEMPKEWITAHDKEAIKEKALYDLKKMPCLYLLDKEKNVILKDATYTEIKEKTGF